VGEREERERSGLGREEVGPERKERPKGRGFLFILQNPFSLLFILGNLF
jgi:hypothetical protein